MKLKKIKQFLIFSAFMIFVAAGFSIANAVDEIDWQVISGGGKEVASPSHKINGTVSQSVIFESASANYGVRHGYWQEFVAAVCDCEPGEVDAVPPINILDIVYLINFRYKNGPEPIPYDLCNGDPNKDCMVNILDIVYLINFKYKNGPSPITCEEWVQECGALTK